MYPFFNSQERVDSLLKEVESWNGTPFVSYSNVKGKGVDCVRLVGTILADVGAIPPIDWAKFPFYPMDWSAHNDEPLLEKAIEALELKYIRIEKDEAIKPGDVMAFAPGKVVHHLGIFTGRNEMFHVMIHASAAYVSLGNAVLQRFYRYSMRPLERNAS